MRAKEHFDLENDNVKSAIKQHINNCDACYNSSLTIDRFHILKKCNNDFQTKIHEAFLIKSLKPSMNKQLHNNGASILLNVFN